MGAHRTSSIDHPGSAPSGSQRCRANRTRPGSARHVAGGRRRTSTRWRCPRVRDRRSRSPCGSWFGGAERGRIPYSCRGGLARSSAAAPCRVAVRTGHSGRARLCRASSYQGRPQSCAIRLYCSVRPFRRGARWILATLGCMTAIDLADYLARKAVPFRDANDRVGCAMETGRTLFGDDRGRASRVLANHRKRCVRSDHPRRLGAARDHPGAAQSGRVGEGEPQNSQKPSGAVLKPPAA